MANFFKDNEDLRFYMERGLDWAPVVELTEYGFRGADSLGSVNEATDFYRDIVELVGEFVGNEVAPHAGTIDRTGVELVDGEVRAPAVMDDIFAKIREMDLHGMCLPRELGGHNCPILVFSMANEMFSRADASVVAHYGFHGGMALAMMVFSIREGTTTFDADNWRIKDTRFAREIEEIRRGDAWGCMDITEPDAGSDMAALRCAATLGDDGVWRLTGQKIFITAGHGKYHFVIARTEEPGDPSDPFAGLGGLSMFLVPTYEDTAAGRKRHVAIGRVEEKLGQHGSATCTMHFEDAPAQLIGKRGEGFAYMLTLMNNARIGVGFESLGLCEEALRSAESYAAERTSMGKPIARHEMIADYLDEMRTDVAAIRAMAMYAAWHEELAQKHDIRLRLGLLDGDDETAVRRLVRHHRGKAREVTPLLKYLAAEKAVDMSRRSLQIHGGVGYTTEYPAERLLRDALVMPIYEGTSQIQALMAMKDALGLIMKRPQAFATRYAQAKWRALSARDELERGVARLPSLVCSAQQHLITKTAMDKVRSAPGGSLAGLGALRGTWDPKVDFAWAMLHAERLLLLMTDAAVARILLEQATAHPDRRHLLLAWLHRAEPRARYHHDVITTTGARIIDMLRGRHNEPDRAAG